MMPIIMWKNTGEDGNDELLFSVSWNDFLKIIFSKKSIKPLGNRVFSADVVHTKWSIVYLFVSFV